MNKYILSLLFSSMLLLLSQCDRSAGDASFLVLPQLGEWYSKGDSISLISVYKEGITPDRIYCFIEQDSVEIYGEEFYYDELISLPIPEDSKSGLLDVGYYTFDSGVERRASQIYYLEKPYGEMDLSFYPPMAMVNSIVEAFCTIESFSGDSYFRWFLEDRLIGEDFHSNGGDRICFYGPAEKGNYTLRVEVYPDKTSSGDHFSPWSRTTELFFNETADKDGRLSTSQWQSLFHCDGTNIDRGEVSPSTEPIGPLHFRGDNRLTPQMVGGDRGFGFSSESYLRYGGEILQGEVADIFMMKARILFSPPSEENKEETLQIFNSIDGGDVYNFSLFKRGETLLFSLGFGDHFERSILDFPSSLENVPFWLSLVIEQSEENLLIRWYLDGILAKEDCFDPYLVPVFMDGGGSTIWGKGDSGYSSFEGVLLEWGFVKNPIIIKELEGEMN